MSVKKATAATTTNHHDSRINAACRGEKRRSDGTGRRLVVTLFLLTISVLRCVSHAEHYIWAGWANAALLARWECPPHRLESHRFSPRRQPRAFAMTTRHTRLLILGSGPAGFTAAV